MGKRFILKLIRVIVRIYVEVFRGTPMILQAVFIYYGIPYFIDGFTAFQGYSGIWFASLLVVSINTGSYMAESVRGGIISVDPGQTEGAQAIGMTHVQTILGILEASCPRRCGTSCLRSATTSSSTSRTPR